MYHVGEGHQSAVLDRVLLYEHAISVNYRGIGVCQDAEFHVGNGLGSDRHGP